jgi:hypothetical protein
VTATERAGAEREEQALALIRDWTNYLRARRLIATISNAPDELFEADDSLDERERATTLLRALPSDQRRLFDAALEERRAHWRTQLEATQHASQTTGHVALVDPDQVDSEALRECLELAEGRSHPNGDGYVRYPAVHSEPITWYDAYVPQLALPPGDAAYQIGAQAPSRRDGLIRILAGIALVPLLGWLAWSLVAPAPGAEATVGRARMNDVALMAWPSLTVVLDGSDGLPIRVTASSQWPADGSAYLREGVRLPLQMCLPAALLERSTTLRLAGDGAMPERAYALTTDKAHGGDLVVVGCDAPTTERYGALRDVVAAPLGEIGDPQRVAAGLEVALQEVRVVGGGTEPAMPAEAAQVVLNIDVVSTTGEIDWTTLAPLLRLADGSSNSAPEVLPRAGGVTLRYLITVPRELLDGEWRLTDPTSGAVTRWRLVVEPPPDRDSLLRQALQVRSISAQNTSTLVLTLVNTSAASLALNQHDLQLEQSGVRLDLPALPELSEPLAAGEARALIVPLPADIPGDLTITVGPQSFRIER